jgi:hypothetical protein
MESEDAISSYVHKWQAFWPEQAILDVFVSKQQITKCHAWVGLLFELQNCAFAIEHDAVREQKALWWSQELKAINHKSVRHPLSQALQEFPVDYSRLADDFLFVSGQAPIRAANTKELLEQMYPMSLAITQIENQLFGGNIKFNQLSVNAISVQLLLMRLPLGLQAFDQALGPMHLLARHQALNTIQNPPALLNDWLDELMTSLNEKGSSNWFREAQTSFCHRRIKHLRNNGKPKIQIGHLWDAWRAMRSHQNT